MLYQWVFFASLMHAVYRPKDPNRMLWVLMEPLGHGIPLHNHLGFDKRPLTHIIGLYHDLQGDLSLLVWGVVERAEGDSLDIMLTLYDSKAALRTRQSMSSYVKDGAYLVNETLSSTYEICSMQGFKGFWPDHLADLPEQELNFHFCQLISCVVDELPFDWEALQEGPPVNSVWPVNLVENRAWALLDQETQESVKVAGGGA
ncbi:hypothetical protein FRC10_005848 [Ceratobasidium sp. 414]|nr:hypothetical protein FRC10_005848 [Ceratobasidium sp. 414]